jgi:hypothetical protein
VRNKLKEVVRYVVVTSRARFRAAFGCFASVAGGSSTNTARSSEIAWSIHAFAVLWIVLRAGDCPRVSVSGERDEISQQATAVVVFVE